MCHFDTLEKYKFFGTAVSWNEARDHCIQLGGDLASMHNQEENDKVQALIQGLHVYIGMNDRETEGDWKWSDSSQVS